MPLFDNKDFKHFDRKWDKPKKGLTVRLSWAVLERVGEPIAKWLGARKRRKKRRK
jgi:hypothetical protein